MKNDTMVAGKRTDLLSRVLADTYALTLKTQNFHWNVTGPHFPQLHKLFEAQYDELAEAVDVVAERIRALGEKAPASFAEFQKLRSLEEGDGELSAEEMVASLLKSHEDVTKTLRAALNAAEADDDPATVDMMTVRIEAHDKTAWMLRSFLNK